jgi:hypothetical protein
MDEWEFSKKTYNQQTYLPNHPHATKRGYVYNYRLEVEETLGRYLLPTEIVHHEFLPNGSYFLIVCRNQREHSFIHMFSEAARKCGNPSWRRCSFCKEYDDLKNLSNNTKGTYHTACQRKYYKKTKGELRVS